MPFVRYIHHVRTVCPTLNHELLRHVTTNLKSVFTSLKGAQDSSQNRAYTVGQTMRFPAGPRGISLLQSVQTYSGVHPTLYSMNTRSSSPGTKWAECEAALSPESRTKVKNDSWQMCTPCMSSWCVLRQLYLYFHSSLNVIRIIKLRRIRWVGYIESTENT